MTSTGFKSSTDTLPWLIPRRNLSEEAAAVAVLIVCVCVCVDHSASEPTRSSVVDRRRRAGHDGGDTRGWQSSRHIQQWLDDVTLEDHVLLPQVKDPNNLTLHE